MAAYIDANRSRMLNNYSDEDALRRDLADQALMPSLASRPLPANPHERYPSGLCEAASTPANAIGLHGKTRCISPAMKLPAKSTDGRACCFCGAELVTATTARHVIEYHIKPYLKRWVAAVSRQGNCDPVHNVHFKKDDSLELMVQIKQRG